MTTSARLTKDRKRHDPAALREFGAGPIEIQCLGGVRIRRGTTDITQNVGKRHLAVLIYVLHERGPVGRRDLFSLLGRGGSDDVEDQAVSRTLAWLSHNLRGLDIELTPESVVIGGDVSLDSVELLDAIEVGDAERVRQLYRGRFLKDFKGPSERFDDWAEGERQRLHEAWMETMRSAAAAAETAGIWTIAAEWWRAMVERDPLKHDAVARLLLTLGLARDRKGAALAYSGYRARLREHGVAEPPDVVRRVANKLDLPEPGDVDLESAYIDPAEEDADDSEKVVVLRPDAIRVGERLKEEEGGPFTDSFVVYAAKTGWAKLTSPGELARARDQLESYGSLLEELLDAIRQIVGAVARPTWSLVRSASAALSRVFREGLSQLGRLWSFAKILALHISKFLRDRLTRPSPRQRKQPTAKAEQARRVTRPRPDPSPAVESVRATRPSVAPSRSDSSAKVEVGARRSIRAKRRLKRRRKRSHFASNFARTYRNIAWKASLRSAWRSLIALPRKALDYPLATLALAFAFAVLLAPSGVWDWSARRYIDAERRVSNFSLPSVPKIRVALPDVSLPDLSLPDIRLPKFAADLPDFVQGPLWTASDFFTGSLVDPGDRVAVADLETQLGGASPSGQVLGVALESQLAQSKYFATVPRERLLVASNSRPMESLVLPSERALELAPMASARVIVSGSASQTEGERSYTVRLVALDPTGIELAAVEAEGAELLRTLDGAARSLRHKLGEPAAQIHAGHPTARILTDSFDALDRYVRARALLETGAYREASRAAGSALDLDPTFAAAHRLQGDALALSGDRRGARIALERAWEFRVRLAERERLRLQADRLALRGDYPNAILAYDELFTNYRDDVAALKSQAILQESIGVRGGGSGNLRVAYSIDSQDWPPLSRVARFLDYGGPLPEISPYINLASEPDDSAR